MQVENQTLDIVIVLAMHGIPPKDFPKEERKAFFELKAALRHAEKPSRALLDQYHQLDKRMRQWPRTKENDPFYFGSMELGLKLSGKTGSPVIVGFNEFCDPDLDNAIGQAAGLASEKVIVTTPMMTRGGGHSKADIPAAISRVKKRYPKSEIIYAWPFPVSDIAGFLAGQIESFLEP